MIKICLKGHKIHSKIPTNVILKQFIDRGQRFLCDLNPHFVRKMCTHSDVMLDLYFISCHTVWKTLKCYYYENKHEPLILIASSFSVKNYINIKTIKYHRFADVKPAKEMLTF